MSSWYCRIASTAFRTSCALDITLSADASCSRRRPDKRFASARSCCTVRDILIIIGNLEKLVCLDTNCQIKFENLIVSSTRIKSYSGLVGSRLTLKVNFSYIMMNKIQNISFSGFKQKHIYCNKDFLSFFGEVVLFWSGTHTI